VRRRGLAHYKLHLFGFRINKLSSKTWRHTAPSHLGLSIRNTARADTDAHQQQQDSIDRPSPGIWCCFPPGARAAPHASTRAVAISLDPCVTRPMRRQKLPIATTAAPVLHLCDPVLTAHGCRSTQIMRGPDTSLPSDSKPVLTALGGRPTPHFRRTCATFRHPDRLQLHICATCANGTRWQVAEGVSATLRILLHLCPPGLADAGGLLAGVWVLALFTSNDSNFRLLPRPPDAYRTFCQISLCSTGPWFRLPFL
jgi:hypothetical protein